MQICENISRLTLPYKDIFTTVYTVRTPEGVLIFDTATTPEDITEGILPFLRSEGIDAEKVKAIFISHFHGDHAGGLPTLLPFLPNATIYARSKKLGETYPDRIIAPEDGDTILGVLQAVTVPGHSRDSSALLDTRTMTLISGDCLQLYGIFGSGAWGSNITLPRLHLQALEKLRAMPLRQIFAAHDYHPLGWYYDTPEAIRAALDACRDSLFRIRDLITQNAALSDEAIALLAENDGALPRIHPRVVDAIRREMV